MVDCRECKHFREEHIENIFAGVCEYADHFDFMEEWQIESGFCDFYESVDCNDTEN